MLVEFLTALVALMQFSSRDFLDLTPSLSKPNYISEKFYTI